jgi:exoribonuclease-2
MDWIKAGLPAEGTHPREPIPTPAKWRTEMQGPLSEAQAKTLLSNHIGELFDGIVTAVTDDGTSVQLLAPSVEGRLVRGAQGLRVGEQVALRLLATSSDLEFSRISRHTR